MMDKQSTPLVWPRRLEFSILTKRVMDEFLNITVNNLLVDVTHLFRVLGPGGSAARMSFSGRK